MAEKVRLGIWSGGVCGHGWLGWGKSKDRSLYLYECLGMVFHILLLTLKYL